VDLQAVAERLGCSVKTIRRRIAAGELRASRIARGRWVITEDDLQAYLDATANVTRLQAAGPVSAGSTACQAQRGKLVITDDMGRTADGR
jgi:excisionase family DNA binding protein